MKNLFRFIALMVLLLPGAAPLFAQRYGVYGPTGAVHWRALSKYLANTIPTTGALDQTADCSVGYSDSVGYRAFYEWNLPDSLIPAGSTIDTVQIQFQYTPSQSFATYFYNCANDIVSSSTQNLQDLWAETNGSANDIAQANAGNGSFNYYYIGQGDPVVAAVQSSLSSQRFALGIRYFGEGSTSAMYSVRNTTITMKVFFKYPTRPVVVDQRIVSTATSMDSIADWESNRFSTYKAPHTFSFYQSDTVTLKATQNLLSNMYKYRYWSADNVMNSNVVNPKQFLIKPTTGNLTAFVDTVQNATIQSQLIDGGNPGGSLNFQDPWLTDSVDQKHGNAAINRGMSAGFNSVAYTSNNLGTSTNYKGMFLNRRVQDTTYYSLRAPLTQTNINGFTGYFQYWSASNATLSQVGSSPSGYDQKAVVFTGSNATVTARYKGHMVSSISQASGYNTQRTLFVDPAGWYNLVYESAGEIWFTYSSDGGRTWSQDTRLSAGNGTAHNPSICQLSNSPANYYVYILWTDVSSTGNGYSIYALSYEWYYHTWYPNIHPEEVGGQQLLGGLARQSAKPVGVMLHDTVYAVAYEGASGIGIITNQGSAKPPWIFYSLPGTNSASENPSIFFDCYSQSKIYVAYDNTSDGDIHMSYWSYSNNLPSFTGPYTVSNSSYASPNVAPSITVDATGRVHFAWTGFDHSLYYQYSVFHRSLVISSLTWSTITQFVYYSGFDEPSICGHTDSNGGATLMFHDRSGNNNVYKVTSTDGVSWNGSGFGLPPTTVANNAVYPNLVSRADPSSVAYALTRSNTTPFALSLGTSNENNGSGTVLYKGGDGAVSAIFDQVVQIRDTSKGLSAILTLSNIKVTMADKQTVPAFLSQIDNLVFTPFQGSAGSVSGAAFDVALKPDSSTTPITVALFEPNLDSPVMTLATISLASSGPATPSLFSANIPSSILTMNTRLGVIVNGKLDTAAQVNLVNVYFIKDSSSSGGNSPQANKLEVPTSYSLGQNYPNPFNPSTTIGYALPTTGRVILKVYDVLGREVRTLVDQYQAAGNYDVVFDASDLPSGVYFYRISAGKFTSARKLVVVK